MVRWLLKSVSLLALLSFIQLAKADELKLQYAGFYDYLKQANSPEFNQVRPAFFLTAQDQNAAHCVKEGLIIAGELRYPIVSNAVTGEFFVPFDKRIKDQRGILLFDAGDTCQLNIAVVGRLHQQQVSNVQLVHLAEQIYRLMEEYAGSVSFMMPDWQAVILVLENGEQLTYHRSELPAELQLQTPVDHVRLAMAQN